MRKVPTMPQGIISVTPLYVHLADAERISGRQASVIKTWIRESMLPPARADTPLDCARLAPLSAATSAAHPEYFYAGEVRQLATPRGRGYNWQLLLAALERVHKARGGYKWIVAALGPATLPPATLAYIAELEQRLLVYTTSGAAGSSAEALHDAQESSALPAGYVSVSSVAKAHGFAESTAATWRKHEQFRACLRYNPAGWLHQQQRVKYALDHPSGVRAFGYWLGRSQTYRTCTQDICEACQARRYRLAGAAWAEVQSMPLLTWLA